MIRLLVVASLVTLVSVVGCTRKKPPVAKTGAIDYSQELAPGQMALRKIPPAEYPTFSLRQSNRADLLKSIDYSLQYLSRASSQRFFPYLDITHERAIASLVALKQTINSASQGMGDAELGREIAAKFEVYQSIGAPRPDGPGFTNEVLFTAYCTPIYDASLTKTGPFQYPLYNKPADLESDPITGEVKGRKMADGSYTPYLTRAQIEEGGALAGQEIVWLKDRFDAYVITIQGSARLKLANGEMLEIGYAGSNGHEYVSPGRQLVADGKLPKDQLNLRGMKAYFARNPQDMPRYLGANPRTVFFAETSGGPYGSLNVPVTSFATIATDKSVYPRAMPGFLVVPMPAVTGAAPYHGFMMDQDTGGAIRAAGRTDIYMGIGPDAEAKSGQQLNAGQLYYVAVKPQLVATYAKDLPVDDEH